MINLNNKFYLFVFLVLLWHHSFSFADYYRFNYRETEVETINPDRGFFDQIILKNSFSFDFSSGLKNKRVYFLLDQYINSDIDLESLNTLEASLKNLEDKNYRLIVRVLYDWPQFDVEKKEHAKKSAVTPSAERIIKHINQLAPIFAAHPKVITLVESGMIGFWGEQHGDISDKQNSIFISQIVDAWLNYLSQADIPVQIRYLEPFKYYLSQRSPSKIGKVGFWNDCLAAYDDKLVSGDFQFSIFSDKPVDGETCQLSPRVDYSCQSMIKYFEAIKIDLLHLNFYKPTINAWQEEGCFDEIKKYLGYRFVIVYSSFNRNSKLLEVGIKNSGWGKSFRSRNLWVNVNGLTIKTNIDVATWTSGSFNVVKVILPESALSVDSLSLKIDDDIEFSNITKNTIYLK